MPRRETGIKPKIWERLIDARAGETTEMAADPVPVRRPVVLLGDDGDGIEDLSTGEVIGKTKMGLNLPRTDFQQT